MPEPASGAVVTAFLFAKFVGVGMGFPSTPDAAYVCGYDQARYSMKAAGTFEVEMAPATDSRFVMRHLEIMDDEPGQILNESVQSTKAAFTVANSQPHEFYFTVVVEDTIRGKMIECDPAVEFEPE